MNDVTIFSTETCPKCVKLKKVLKEHGVEYSEMRMDSEEGLTELRCNNVFTNNAPVMSVGEDFYIHTDLFNGNAVNIDAVKEFLSLE